MNSDDANPYEAPVSSNEQLPVRRTRWRIIPVTLLTIFGGIQLLWVPMLISIMIESAEYDGGVTFPRVMSLALMGPAAVGYLTAAYLCWRGR